MPGLDGGFVVCGQSTSRMTKGEMSEMQELMAAFGAERGVKFSAVE
ncbi:recombination protein NinB [Pseudomonas fulva]|nr:recombination protein NinB [Pseudomonas fulva]